MCLFADIPMLYDPQSAHRFTTGDTNGYMGNGTACRYAIVERADTVTEELIDRLTIPCGSPYVQAGKALS